ncbi:MAG: GTP-binding protein, partial [Pseudomonadota bacterium]
MTHATVAVIGHVDHGKTILVKALTGVDTDTLQEEKQRGLSITLGFAHLAHGSGQIHLIDTPGHADFIRMTASGISGADAVLLVISAMDGVQPQTLEHIRLAQYFGIRNVTVALTKSDLTQARNVDALQAEIESILDAHAFTHVAIIACSSVTGAGLENVVAALSSAFEYKHQRPDLKGFFLPIDRVFSAPGAGTIVTGTLLGAGVTVGDDVVLEPQHLTATIRGIQIAGASQDQAEPGARVALNLRGIDAGALTKGDVLCAPGAFQTGLRFDVSLRPCSDVKHMEQVKVLLGTGHCAARLRLYPSKPDQSVYGQLEFKTP